MPPNTARCCRWRSTASPLPEDPEFLIFPSSDGKAKPGLGVDALPDTAQICSCNNVTKGNLCEAVGDGARTIADLKACTRRVPPAAAAYPWSPRS